VLELTQTLAIALRWAQSLLPKSKYSYLVEEELMSRSEFELAGRAAQRKGIDIEDLLLDEFLLSPASIGNALSSFYGVPYEPINADRIRPTEQLKNLKRDYVESSHWIPIEDTQEGLVILTTDPERIRTSGVVKNILCRDRLIYKVCSQREFKATVDLFFGPQWEMSELTSTLFDDGGDEPSISEEDVNKMINLLIEDAYKMGASDIHIEPGEGKVKTVIRLRINGSMINHLEVPWTCRDALVNRVKFMCDLDTAEKRKPQVGRIKFEKFGSLDLELRVSIVPVHGGVEHVTLRILALGLAHGEPIPLDSLGFSARNLPLLKRTISLPYGLFIVCGPTGSGRTTTLHSVLNCINTLDIKIWTAEDPVEINQKGLNQVQINEAAGLDFATAMQTILSSDPDVIMVSEPRDAETVSTIIDASLLGHMVFTTLHANNAPEAIIRLQDLVIDNFNFTDAFLGVLAQRLARRLCPHCKKPHEATTEELKSLLTEYSSELLNTESWNKDQNSSLKALFSDWVKQFGDEKGNITLYEKVGCEKCSGVGYRGRIGLHELLTGTKALKNGLLKKASTAELTAIALEDGMRTMRQDGIEKVLMGVTDMQIVRAVCDK
jgi:type II secretory ATPase GspE/PulE/Tfp pilus assembly ATPase PilB-like protein